MGLASIYIAYKAGKRKQERSLTLQEVRDERLAKKQAKDLCRRCRQPYVKHTRDNSYRCP